MNSVAGHGSSRLTSKHRVDSRHACPLLDRIIAAPDAIIDSCGQVLKHDRTTTVSKIEGDGMVWVVKRYNTKNAWHAVRRTLRRSRALNCWEMSGRFLAAGIKVPARIACIENKLGPFHGRSFFVCEYVDAEDLISFLKNRNDPGDMTFISGKIEALFDALRASRIIHGDMKATNILVSAERNLTLLDLDAARQPADTRTFERGHAQDRSRFLRNWDHDPERLERFVSALQE